MDVRWEKTKEIEKLLIRIEVAKSIINVLPPLPNLQAKLQRESILKSSLFSAKIEGNTLQLSQIQSMDSNPQELEKKEVSNLFKATTLVKNIREDLTLKKVKEIHAFVMDQISSESGKLRIEPSAIFNQAGIAIYMTPSPQKITKLIQDLLKFINLQDESVSIANVAVSHYEFEKIHPFLDGNGRVGRLISSFHMRNLGFEFKNLISFEEYVHENRDAYYYGLSLPNQNITEFVEFFLTAIAVSAENIIEKLRNKKEETIEDTLLPRRAEILYVIRDHEIISFDQIRRRFLKVSERALHNDLVALVKVGLIKKLGATRGAMYSPI